MDPYRTNRLNQSLREVLAELLQTEVKDPRVGFVTVSKVELNKDHSVARVFWSVMGEEEERRLSFAGLKKAAGFLQSRAGRTLGLRQAPELRFEYDGSVERGLELDGMLDTMREQGEFLDEHERMRRLCLDELVPPRDLMAALEKAERIWIAPHVNPDPDAIGAALALAEGLDEAGKDVTVVGYPDAAVGVTGLPGYDRIVTEDHAALLAEDAPDILVLVDCHRIERTGPLEGVLANIAERWCIDHHLVSQRKAPEAGWVDARACSSCTLVHQVVGALRDEDGDPVELSLDMATNLYAGLLNDTGGFRFDNTVPFTFEFARRLSERGVDTAGVAASTLHRYRRAGVAMLEKVLGTFSYHANGRIVVARATQEMIDQTGGDMGDTEGFVNIAMSVDGVQMAAFMKEKPGGGVWRISLRCREGGDVQQVAARYGGGGHRQAAGCDLEGPADEVAALLAAELEAVLP